MNSFLIGDKVQIDEKEWKKEGVVLPELYGLRFENKYTITRANKNLVWVDGSDHSFHYRFFKSLNSDSIAKPILEERKIGKVKMQLFDEGFPNAVMEIAKVMSWAEQNKGYKPNDFKNLPNADVEFSAAASRHKLKGLIQKDAGLPPLERVDEESGIVHLAHQAFNILAELELVLTGRIKE